MSVFSDFQRMWQERFPHSSLSEAWEKDVRASLERHKQRIAELTKELEQESLYVEYLERLLSDVEKSRENGSDPALLVDAATPTINRTSASEKDGSIAPVTNADTNNETLIRAASNPSVDSINSDESEIIRKKDSDEVQLRKNCPLNQCINELSSNLSPKRYSEPTRTEIIEENSASEKNQVEKNHSNSEDSDSVEKVKINQSDSLGKPSHFVTVIEVKDPSGNSPNSSSTSVTQSTGVTSTTSSFKSIRSGYENVIIENNKRNSMEQNDTKSQTSSFSNLGGKPTSAKQAAIALLSDAKKKIPPRPPPKYIRRPAHVEPPSVPGSSPAKKDSDSSPSSSLERNIKPSEIFRQKSSDSLEVKITSRREKSALSKSSDLLTDEFGKKLAKSESLKSTQSSSGSLGSGTTKSTSSPTGSLDKLAVVSNSQQYHESPTGSLGKIPRVGIHNNNSDSVGSKESLHGHGPSSGGAISNKIKSFESISSLSSDSMKMSQNIENEPYYDTVPNEPIDTEYVYLQTNPLNNTGTITSTGTTGSSSSRDDVSSTAGSTLPLPFNRHPHSNSQSSVIEPESPGKNSNYVNIDYFIQKTRDSRVDSDDDVDRPSYERTISGDSVQHPRSIERQLTNHTRGTIIQQIISSIITSETIYVECLNKMNQYKRAINATLTTSQPVISNEESETMFFKIEELYEVHSKFLKELKEKQQNNNDGDILLGETFKNLVANMHLYSAFLHNYGRAIDTVKKCGSNSTQFKEIVSKIVLNSLNEQSLTLEDLLHKPVARVQKNALIVEDLLQNTPESHPDYQPLKQAHKVIRNFLSEFNVVRANILAGDDKSLRRLVKNSFIVELADGHRKLRHLFLFNDVIACAKYKPSGRERFEFDLKWFIAIKDVLIISDESSPTEPKENSPVNIVQLKSQACTVRDQIMMEEKDEKKSGSRSNDKHRKKLAELEAQLVLASPNLVFKIRNKSSNKTMTFFLSSDFERTQWIESILGLQEQMSRLPGSTSVSIMELQAWILACQNMMKTEMGSYLMRNCRDESLLVGDLHLTIQGLSGLEQPADLYICVEVDSYGHYFRKAKTKLICRSSSPLWNESFVIELEGSQNLRVLLYQDDERPKLKAKYVLELSRYWLKELPINKPLNLSDTISLNTTLKFVPAEVSLRRVPTSKPGALFGAKLSSVLKREKREIPFIISASIREVERRGMSEVGIYRVSGSASDLVKLKKSFESNAYEAEQLLKEVDIHSVTGILKSYLRELPEALFTDALYKRFFDTFNQYSTLSEQARTEALKVIFQELPPSNKSTINLILDHLIRVNNQEVDNKMSLHNLAMVFGPTLLRPGPQSTKQNKDQLETSTVDVMGQAGILYSFLQDRLKS